MKPLTKKIFITLILLVLSCLCFSLFGCADNSNSSDNNNENNNNETPIETVAEITAFDGATIDDDKIFMLVEKDIESVSLSGKVQVSKDSTWKLYSDKLGRNEIPTKVAASSSGELINGDNQFTFLFLPIPKIK